MKKRTKIPFNEDTRQVAIYTRKSRITNKGGISSSSYEDHLCIDGFRNRRPQGVHSLHPFHLIVGFQRFGNALTLRSLLHKPFSAGNSKQGV